MSSKSRNDQPNKQQGAEAGARAGDAASRAADADADAAAAADDNSDDNSDAAAFDEFEADDSLGRPIGRDELDPELMSLSRPRTRIGVLLAASVVVFCVYIMIRLYSDLRFARQGDEPRAIDIAAVVAGDVSRDQFVTVRAVPDRVFAARIAKSAADDGSRAVPVQGTDGALWVLVGGNVWATRIQYDEVYTGRLRKLADLPFYDALRSHMKERGPSPRYVQADVVRDVLSGAEGPLRDPAGDKIEVAPTTPVAFTATLLDRARIEVRAETRSAAEWTQLLTDAGVVPPGTTPQENDKLLAYDVTAAGGAEAVRAKLAAAVIPDSRVEPITRDYRATWGELVPVSQETFRVGGAEVAWAGVEWIGVSVPRTLRSDAWVLIADERPDAYWYVLPLYIVMALLALLFAWALVRSLRAELTRRDEDTPAALAEGFDDPGAAAA